ncbi:MAG: uroporphyrinogen decarboxylase [Deltaproteobacteria bacterium]|nr:uroporphyrinogen decarboxylase [Deltaproteobacteria bacterium]
MNNSDSLLIRAAFKQPVERTPIWVLRQAGRYLPEYLAVRAKAGSFLDLCMNPELAAEVSIQPLDLMEVDAVIMFSDILTPLMGMGIDLDFKPGPQIHNPVQSLQDIEKLIIPDPSVSTAYVGEILGRIRKRVAGRAPVIGFAGAPFTLAYYLVKDEQSKLFANLTTLFFNDSQTARLLMSKLTRMTIDYLNYQIENGAQMVQLFDTWAGILNPSDYKEYIFPYVSEIFASLNKRGEVPVVYYINGGNHLLELMSQTGADVISLDWKTDIGEAKRLIGKKVALQGNLNPSILFCRPDVISKKAEEIIQSYNGDTGHIFNLGHGIDKAVNPQNLLHLVRTVKELTTRDP